MCGIFGALGPVEPELCRQAFRALAHRGPDASSWLEKDGLYWGHKRLAITEVGTHANQPVEKNGLVLSFNGEIYNYLDLKKELGLNGAPMGEAEILLEAYHQWGELFVEKCVGMFAIALYDHGVVKLYRDRFGKKPLYYLHRGEVFCFASEIKALTPFLPAKKLNEDALLSYLSFLAPTPPHTFYQGIEKLGAGEMIQFKAGHIARKIYYNLMANIQEGRIYTEPEAIASVHTALENSLKLRSRSEVSMAALLSGGIDSAVIAKYLKSLGQEIPTFTIGYENYAKYDETQAATETAQLMGFNNSRYVMGLKDFQETLEPMLTTLDEPLNDPAALPLYWLLGKIAEQGHKVVFSGEGSDEIFLGYRHYFELLDMEQIHQLQHKKWMERHLLTNFSMTREWEWHRRVFSNRLLFRSSGENFTDRHKNRLLQNHVRDDDNLKYISSYRQRFEEAGLKHPSTWYSAIDLQLFQGEHFLMKLDKCSMAHGLEARTPFLDHRLVETVLSVDPQIRCRARKYLLKETVKNAIHGKILARSKKGFAYPYIEWLRESGGFSLIRKVNSQTGLLDAKELDFYLDQGARGKFKHHVWGLYVLSHWLSKNFLGR
jgi:asparagine synthase (glutamine-hydrolysing)